MILDVNETYQVRLKEVYEPIELVSSNGDNIFVCMRDGGFEIATDTSLCSIQSGKFRVISFAVSEKQVSF